MAAEFADIPRPQKLWTIADLGGWKAVDRAVRQGDRLHRHDLQRKQLDDHYDTTEGTGRVHRTVSRAGLAVTEQPLGGPHRGMGVAMLWLSLIVLLPLAALGGPRSATAAGVLGRGDLTAASRRFRSR